MANNDEIKGSKVSSARQQFENHQPEASRRESEYKRLHELTRHFQILDEVYEALGDPDQSPYCGLIRTRSERLADLQRWRDKQDKRSAPAPPEWETVRDGPKWIYTTLSDILDVHVGIDPAGRVAIRLFNKGENDARTMTLPKELLEQFPLKSDAELYDMLAHQEEYLPEALAAAKDELSKRNLAPERVAQLEAGVQSRKAAADTKAQERLGWPMRIFIFIFCAGLLGAVLAVYYDSRGYKRKSSDCWITLGVSIPFHLLAGAFLYATR